MVRIERVLCPIDFSDASRHALAAAIRLARWYDADVDAVHVASTWPRPLAATATRTPGDNGDVLARLDRLVREFDPTGGMVAPLLVHGETVPAILEAATTRQADVVVMGVHDRRMSRSRGRASITDALTREAPCPVLAGVELAGVCPREDAPFRRVLCAIDFSKASLRAMAHALSLAQMAQGRITLLHVLDVASDRFSEPPPAVVHMAWLYLSDDLRGRLRAAVPEDARQWCDVQERLAMGDTAEEIVRAAAAVDADVIVMGAPRTRAEGWSPGRGTRRSVLKGADCPVLVVPENERAAAVATSSLSAPMLTSQELWDA